MATTAYATVDDMIHAMDKSTTTTYSALERTVMARCLDSASRAVDGVCRRSFWQTDAGTVQYYTPYNFERLRVRDLVSVSALATDEDGDLVYELSWTSSEYLLYPIDAATADAVARPYTEIRASMATGSAKYAFPVGREKSVKVTGVWGWPSVPDVIRDVTILEALRSYEQFQAPSGVITNSTAGTFTITPAIHPTSAARLKPYIRMAWGRA